MAGGRPGARRSPAAPSPRLTAAVRRPIWRAAQPSSGTTVSGEPFIEVDHGPDGAAARFERPLAIVSARAPDEAAGGAGGARRGAGGRPLGRRLRLLRARLRLRAAARRADAGAAAAAAARVRRLRRARARRRRRPRADSWDRSRPTGSRADYAAAFARVADYIRAGDIYQANLTMPLRGRWGGDPAAIQAALAAGQPVGHGALVRAARGHDPVALARAVLPARRRAAASRPRR